MKNESIKVGNTIYEIANGYCNLNELSGYTAKVAIVIGTNRIEDIHKTLSENTTVIKYDVDGVEEWTRDNLVYTGVPSFNFSFPLGPEQVQTGTDEKGNPIYEYRDIRDAVLIAEYRTPSLQDEIRAQREQIKGLNAQVAYLQMLSGVEVDHE